MLTLFTNNNKHKATTSDWASDIVEKNILTSKSNNRGGQRSQETYFTAYELQWSKLNWTPVCELQCEQLHWNTCVQNWLSINRPSFAAANNIVQLTRMTMNMMSKEVN